MKKERRVVPSKEGIGCYETAAITKEKVIFRDEIILLDGKIMHGESILTPVLNEARRCVYAVSVT